MSDNQIKHTRIGEVDVSTIRLPSAYGYAVAETVVFGGDLDGRGERYESIREAEAGHDRWIERVRSGDTTGTQRV